MRTWRGWLALGLALALALVGLVAPPLWDGLAQGRIENEVSQAGCYVTYNEFGLDLGRSGWIGRSLGRKFAYRIRFMCLQDCKDPVVLAGLVEKARGLNSVDSVTLDGRIVDRGVLEQVAQMRSLEWIYLFGRVPADLTLLGQLPGLRVLGLEDVSGITPEVLDTLSRFETLEELDLSGSDIQAGLLHRFGQFDHLEELYLEKTRITGQDLLLLKDAPKLRIVRVGSDIPDAAALDEIRKALPRIEIQVIQQTP